MDKVIVYLSLSREELLAQLAEECSEAAQAALKLRRAGSEVTLTLRKTVPENGGPNAE